MRRSPSKVGFTLIEIAFAIAIVSGAVLVIMAFFPMGIKTQTQARFKIIAASKVLEMMEWFRDGSGGGFITDGADNDKEGIMPWDSPMSYRTFAPDLEVATCNLRGGLKPLPRDIAYRIDSDGDEIRKLLDAGGYVFYCSPSYMTGFLDGPLPNNDTAWMPESRKLLVGVTGYPQQNSILYHPSVKVGPYQEFYPSPPTYTHETYVQRPNTHPGDGTWTGRYINLDALCRDPDIATVTCSVSQYDVPGSADAAGVLQKAFFGYKPYHESTGIGTDASDAGLLPNAAAQDKAKAASQAYVLAAYWYAKRAGLTWTNLQALTSISAIDGFVATNHQDFRKVLALRYLAHALSTLSRHYSVSDLTAGVVCDLNMTAETPALTDDLRVTLDNIKGLHETCLRMAIEHADQGAYDWGAPRPLNRQVMMDNPLCALDLWSPAIKAVLPATGSGTTVHRQWKACYPKAIRNPGVPFSYTGRIGANNGDTDANGVTDHRDPATTGAWNDQLPRNLDCGPAGCTFGVDPNPTALTADRDGVLDEKDHPVPAGPGAWQGAVGPPAHCNLTRPFEPFERCRQVVVWAVDWQSYEDFETAPSAPVDSSRYPIVAPYPVLTAATQDHWSSAWTQRAPHERQGDCYHKCGLMMSEAVLNPEQVLLFREPSLVQLSSETLPRSDIVMTVADINNFGGNYDLPPSPGCVVNEVNPLAGESPEITQLFPGTNTPCWPASDQPALSANRKIFVGAYGANRNGVPAGVLSGVGPNRNDPPISPWGGEVMWSRYYTAAKVDGGSVPKTVNLRATTVCRFNYYDGRVSGALRN
ncbi:MAG: type II secretion system protein [Planctomycetes bacterium]|nr:type II secretion system protein [Planctomycetota bacterium]